jgi:hypothetical protein
MKCRLRHLAEELVWRCNRNSQFRDRPQKISVPEPTLAPYLSKINHLPTSRPRVSEVGLTARLSESSGQVLTLPCRVPLSPGVMRTAASNRER